MHAFNRFALCFLSLLFLAAATPSYAKVADISPITATEYKQERVLFQQAIKHLKNNNDRQFRQLQQKLKHYPLSPYLEYYQLNNQFKSASSSDIERFSSQYKDLPLASRLKKRWLNHLYKRQKWSAYSRFFDKYPVATAHYQCQKLFSDYKAASKAKQKKVLESASELWLVGYSQPKACDPLFKVWMNTGHPTSQEATQRFWMSVEKGNIKLARYLSRFIKTKKHKKEHDQFWQLYNKPTIIPTRINKLSKENRESALSPLYKQWFKQQPITAIESWTKQRKDYYRIPLDDELTLHMGLRINQRYHSEAIRLSALLDPDYRHPKLTEYRIRHALSQQQWQAVYDGILNLPAKERAEARWDYWSAIAQTHIFKNRSQEKLLNKTATDRSFYGFLAAEINDTPFVLNDRSSQPERGLIKSVASLPATKRAFELFLLKRITEANREWYQLQKGLSVEERISAAHIANSWGWHIQAVINAAKAKNWDLLDLRFPQPHRSTFRKHAKKHGLDLSFPIAIARQESVFLTSARSPVGARGMMQLMPKTAKQTSRKHKIPYKKLVQLNNPQINIALGSAYLGDMYKRFGHNPAYAAAAYNAGPHRVKRWLKERGDLPLDIWIETIPFRETRNYVQNVLAFRVIYDRLAGRKANLLTDKQLQLLAYNRNSSTAQL